MKKIIIEILVILFCLLSPIVHATDYFSRALCQFDGDGTSYECASGARQSGAWNDLIQNVGKTVGAGDTWYLCGVFGPGHARLAAPTGQMVVFFGSGVAGSPIIVDGDCSGFGGSAKGVLDGEGTPQDIGGIRHGVNIGAYDYITIRNLDIRNIFGDGLNGNGIKSTSTANASNLIIRDNIVSNVRSQCMTVGGENYLVDGNSLKLCGNDGIYISNGVSGTSLSATGLSYGRVSNNTIDRVSENGNDGGDGIKIQKCTNETGVDFCSVVITGNTVYKTGANKAAINVFGAGNGAIVSDNAVYGHEKGGNLINEASDAGIGLDGCGSGATCFITGNYVEGFRTDGIVISGVLESQASGDVYISSNVVEALEGASVCGIDIQTRLTSGLYINNNVLGRNANIACGIGSNSAAQANPFIVRGNRISAGVSSFFVSNTAQSSWNSDYNIFDSNAPGLLTQNTISYTLSSWVSTFGWDRNSQQKMLDFGVCGPR